MNGKSDGREIKEMLAISTYERRMHRIMRQKEILKRAVRVRKKRHDKARSEVSKGSKS